MERGLVQEYEILLEDIVPGDLVKLSAGSLIPGDVRLVESKDLYISQSALTGEALPVEKKIMNESQLIRDGFTGIELETAEELQYHHKRSQNGLSFFGDIRMRMGNFVQEVLSLNHDDEVNLPSLDVETEEEKISSSASSKKSLLDRPDVCFMGTSVVSGKGKSSLPTYLPTYLPISDIELISFR